MVLIIALLTYIPGAYAKDCTGEALSTCPYTQENPNMQGCYDCRTKNFGDYGTWAFLGCSKDKAQNPCVDACKDIRDACLNCVNCTFN